MSAQMEIIFEELDFQETPLGEISLRKRTEPRLDGKLLYEVKLNDEFLMSSLFTESEIQLSKLGLAALKQTQHKNDLDIIVGGLGLGYTAVAALEDPAIRSLKVIEVMKPVIDWHQRGLVPLGKTLTSDPRCTFINADFFALATSDNNGFENDAKQVHAVLLDIDHSPTHWLNEGNRTFYTEESLKNLTNKILPGGIFGLWSNDPPDNDFISLLNKVFQSSESHIVSFPNLYSDKESSCTVYVAYKDVGSTITGK
jgi:spermidine synthase